MDTQPILYEKKETIGIITLNRPENRNSMDSETLPAFRKILDQVKQYCLGAYSTEYFDG